MAASDLLQSALAAQSKAYAPYSRFSVGCALRANSGNVYLGCNVENVAYPEGTCAEAGAIAAMVMGGDREISELVVVADSPSPVPPCGGCRQKIAEFAKSDARVVMATTSGTSVTWTVAELLPGRFDASHMAEATG